ncbi:TIGR04255 family protein [Salmonella enterica]|nr:TIGR04255 family protein [Salmonella enterica]
MSTNIERMSNAPVYYALVQVKFTPVAAMSKYVPDIQDALRVEGFPLFEVSNTTQFKFEMKSPNEPLEHLLESVTTWLMVDTERKSGFILGNDFITFHTTDYDNHVPFIAFLILGLSKVLEFAKPSLISRIGLRYLDAVFPEESETIEQYLVKELHGVDFGWTPIQSIQEFVYQTSVEPLISHGFMVSRVHKMNGRLGFPPDVRSNGLLLLSRFRNTENRMHSIIDTDHYVEGNMETDLLLIEKQLFSLHSKVKEAFKGMVSDFACSKWH